MESDSSQIPMPTPRKSRGSFAIRFTLLLIIIGAIAVAGGIAVLRNDRFQFKEVTVTGPETFSQESVGNFTRNYWAQNYVGSVPYSNTLLFSKSKFEKLLKKEFPIIDIAYVTIPNPRTLDIQIRERLPKVVWCFADETCGFVDGKGIIYGNAPHFSEGVYPIFTSENLASSSDIMGTPIMNPEQITRFADLFNKLQTSDVTLSNINFLSNGDMEFAIEKLFGTYPADHARILGTVNQDDVVFLRDITTGLSQEVFKKQYLAAPKTLEYIDLRFPGKVFYKFSTNTDPIQ